MQASIPERAASRYAGQYENTHDVERLFQVLRDSLQIALESKVADTAQSRYDLALECYHQLASMGLPAEIVGKITEYTESMVERFPTAWRVNAAMGAVERAEAAKRVETQTERLGEAREILSAGLGSGEAIDKDELTELLAQVERRLSELASASESADESAEPDAAAPAPAPAGAAIVLAERKSAPHIELDDLPGDLSGHQPGAPTGDGAAEGSEGPTARPHVDVTLGLLPRVHLAMLQERRAGVHTLRLVNQGAERLEGLELQITSDPPFIRPSTLRIDKLGAGEELDLGPRRIASFLSHDRSILARLSERSSGSVTLTLRDQAGADIATTSADWTLFPTDTWFGLGTLPELLAAYVLPNDPAVEATLSLAAQHLAKSTDSPTIDGYQSKDPIRALRIVEAVYSALRDAQVTYANPPASFENDGQRVRFPSAVISSRLGTCVDLALFAAAVLEQAGLHPLVVVTEGHAFVATWLVEETFANPVVEEPTRLAKRLELSELVAFDATCVSLRPSPDFEGAREAARERLADPSEFRLAIDVHRARLGGVLPLPTLEAGVHGGSEGVEQGEAVPTKSARDLDEELRVYLEAERRRREEDETPDTRLDRWLRQLLDLTMRNRLLNSSTGSKRIIPLIPGNLGAIEDRLADGKSFRILDRPIELEGMKPSQADAERIAPLLVAGVQAGELRSWLTPSELDERLLNLYREARTAREEGGAGALYLAVGFLVYRETKQSTKMRRAPLLLLPLELTRKSARRGYTLAQGGDEPRANVTLLEYLRRDHQIDVTGLDPLPTDDRGIDVPLVLQVFKNAIKDEDGWEIVDEAEIGLYSFAKYLLWRDLKDRADVLRRNELVAHLIERPSEPFPDRVAVPDPDQLDQNFSAAEVFAPLSYDSSQLSAILAAADGKTMVLEGPPGTGKSQTITNLIAHAIAQEKTVLFVSEKMAALDVVHRRLRHLGLGPACLELHSNKANKKVVLEQFRESLEEGRVRGARRRPWAEIAEDLDAARGRLNGHVTAMHRERGSGESLHEVIGQTAGEEAQGGESWDLHADLGIADPKAVDADTLRRWRELLAEVDVVAAEQAVGATHPLLLVGQDDYSPIFENESRVTVAEFDAPASEFLSAANAALAGLNASTAARAALATEEQWTALTALLALLAKPHPGSKSAGQWLTEDARREGAADACELAAEYQGLVNELAGNFRVSPTTLPLETLEGLRREYVGGGFFKRWRAKSSLLGELRGIANDPKQLSIEAAIRALDAAQRQREIEPLFADVRSDAELVLGQVWSATDTDATAARSAVDAANALAAAWAQFAGGLDLDATTQAELVQSVAGSIGDDSHGARGQRLALAVSQLRAAKEPLLQATKPLTGAPLSASLQDVEALQSLSITWADSWSSLRGWSRWQGLRRQCLDAETAAGGLQAVIERLEAGGCNPGEARARFDSAFAKAWALHEISGDDALKAFDGADHNRALSGFRSLDDERLTAAREEVRQRTGSRRPTVSAAAAATGKSAKTGLGLLQREITKKTRHLAIRRLLAELDEIAMQLKPCFLMSPMSVAQYLDADHPPFDIVVFDEASQIPVWDAIGAIARGNQAVIVGDPKQLPPTSFFSRSADVDSIDEDEVEDLESILEECIGAQVPTHRLRWHYRSRHESLIAFSNERYYDSKLLTFPSGASEGRGVQVAYHADAVYDKGSTRTNKIEAQAVAAEVVRRLLDPKEGDRSIGVVTFSQAQQTLVLDLLDAAARKHPEIERFFDESIQEPVFVKNLENVQGDERDVIIFSIGYGPDANGRLSMNFGPLNNDGGERRLNVAITRAREEVLVHTSIRSDQIDLARTNARGVRDLRAFLSFAESNQTKTASQAGTPGPVTQSHDALVRIVGERLAQLGWEVEYEIGRSDVRVDIGVRHPERDDAFLAGIETDGANYRRASTARDRDRLRSDVLAGLGWKLIPVWAVDFWRDADTEVDRIHGELQRLLKEEPKEEPTPVGSPIKEPAQIAGAPVEEAREEAREEDREDGHDETPEIAAAPERPKVIALPAASSTPLLDVMEDKADPSEPMQLPAASANEATPMIAAGAASPSSGIYEPAHIAGFEDRVAEFYDDEQNEHVAATIRRVIEAEAPLTEETLVRRIASTWGFAAVSKKFRERVGDLVALSNPASTEHAAGDGATQRLYWRRTDEASSYSTFRTQDSQDARPFSEVPQPELVQAMLATLAQQPLWPLDDLQKEVLSLFGGKRMTQAVRGPIGAAIDTLQETDRIRMEISGGVASVALTD